MSFRLGDLKKSVRKGKQGYLVAPVRLDSRQHAFRLRFVLEEFEKQLGQPRRTLDPEILLDFLGDRRIGRGVLAALSQWYRMRPRSFAEVLDGSADSAWRERFREEGIERPHDLRAWLYAAINRTDPGFLTPDRDPEFWERHARELGLRRAQLEHLTVLDRAEEAILVRTGPAPSAQDVMAAYNARAHTTLLRSAQDVTLRCYAPASLVDRAATVWAGALGLEHQTGGKELTLRGAADALGNWTRHGRRVERAVLELLAIEELEVREVTGRLSVSDRQAAFTWKADLLAALGSGAGGALDTAVPEELEGLVSVLRKARETFDGDPWTIRRASCVVASARAVRWPHLELRSGDRIVYVRYSSDADETGLEAFAGRTPFVLAARDRERWHLRSSDGWERSCTAPELLSQLALRLGPAEARSFPNSAVMPSDLSQAA